MVNLEIVELQKRGFTLLPLLISHTPRPLSRQQFRLSVMPTSQAFSATRPINPPGVEPVLSEDQVWQGLQIKARAPQEFVKMSVDGHTRVLVLPSLSPQLTISAVFPSSILALGSPRAKSSRTRATRCAFSGTCTVWHSRLPTAIADSLTGSGLDAQVTREVEFQNSGKTITEQIEAHPNSSVKFLNPRLFSNW